MNLKKHLNCILLLSFMSVSLSYSQTTADFSVSGQTVYHMTENQTSIDASFYLTYGNTNTQGSNNFSHIQTIFEGNISDPRISRSSGWYNPAYYPDIVTANNLTPGTYSLILNLVDMGGILQSESFTITVYPATLSTPLISFFSQSPDPVNNGGTVTITANLSQGSGNSTYQWFASYSPSAMTFSFTPNGNSCTINYYCTYYNPTLTINLTCVASNSLGTDVKSYSVHCSN